METNEIRIRKEKLEKDIEDLICEFEKDTQILSVSKVWISEGIVRTELKVTI